MKLTFLGKISDLTDNELMELYDNPNINGVSKTNINFELVNRLKQK